MRDIRDQHDELVALYVGVVVAGVFGGVAAKIAERLGPEGAELAVQPLLKVVPGVGAAAGEQR